jgi:hypothetical protein
LGAEVVQECVPVPVDGGTVLVAVGAGLGDADVGVGVAGVGMADVGVAVGDVLCGLGLCVDDRAAGEDEEAAMLPSCGWQPAAAMMAAATTAEGKMIRARNSLYIGGFLSLGSSDANGTVTTPWVSGDSPELWLLMMHRTLMWLITPMRAGGCAAPPPGNLRQLAKPRSPAGWAPAFPA